MEKKKGETAYVPKLFTPRNEARDIFRAAPRAATGGGFWRWGSDNLYPYALAQMFRRSTTHRRIVNDKADYIAGKGFSHEEGLPRLAAFIRRVNRDGETLRQVLRKLALDKVLFGNAFVEVVTDGGASFLSLFHQDASRCRLITIGRSMRRRRRNRFRCGRSRRREPTGNCMRLFITRSTSPCSAITAFRPT